MSVEATIGIWQLIVLVITLLVLVGTLVYILRTLGQTRKQTELLRKQLVGEVYDKAQISDLRFYLPARRDHTVEGFEQKQQEDRETNLDKCIQIPVGQERELHIKWKMTESQTLRSFTIGFHIPEGQSAFFENNPEVIENTVAFVKKSFSRLPREEYIDWHEVYHCEYGHARRLPQDEDFVISLKVKGRKEGEYFLDVKIQVSEAPNPFEEQLRVDVAGA